MSKQFAVLLLLPLCLKFVSCDRHNDTAEQSGLSGTWEADLSRINVSALKGQIVFKGNRYVYTWYQLKENSGDSSEKWIPVEMEQGNIIMTRPGVIELLADSYGYPSHSAAAHDRNETDYKIMPSKSDYLIHYEIKNDQLIWKDDSNLDGKFDDVNETFVYQRVK